MPALLAVAVVGAGIHGSRYAEHLLRGDVPGARLAGVCRRSAADSALWTSRGVRFEAYPEALFADPAVDAFVIASPNALHEEHAKAALGRGKPVLLEKPVAADLAGCARIREAAARAGVPVLVGHTFRHHPVVRGFREEARRLAPLRWLSLSQRHERMPMEWQLRGRGSGALLNTGVHMADLARWVLGEDPGEPQGAILDAAPGESEGTAAALLRSPSGTMVSLEVSIVAAARRGHLEARGDGGVVEGDFRLHELSRREGWTRVPLPVPPLVPGLPPLLQDFVRVVGGGSPGDSATLEDGIAAVEIVERIRASVAHSPR